MSDHHKQVWLKDEQMNSVRLDLGSVNFSGREMQSVVEDLPLIQAALFTDSIVVSSDDEARGLFATACRKLSVLGPVLWVNPTQESDPQRWLSQGAPSQPDRMLCSYAARPSG
jgi:hypothetical protein